MQIDLRFDSNEIPLLIDLYELTMAASYFALGLNRRACFGLSVHRLPPHRGFLVAAGLERLLEALEQFRFEPAILEYVTSLQLFKEEFLDFLGKLRFTGEVHGLAEGTIFFAGEPIIEVFRAVGTNGHFYTDLIGLTDETASTVARQFNPNPASTIPLLSRQFADGHRLMPRPTLAESRQSFPEAIEQLDPCYKALEQPETYPA